MIRFSENDAREERKREEGGKGRGGLYYTSTHMHNTAHNIRSRIIIRGN
jgi:hypothetical protein